MRSISFFLTTDQVRRRSKTVTRRLGWINLQPGTLLRAVVKAQGLKVGEKQEQLAIIRVLDVRREKLWQITPEDIVREGFPKMTKHEFLDFFCASHKCTPEEEVTRIEFEYL